MLITVIAVGTKMPAWVQTGCQEYIKRLPRDWQFKFIEQPIGPRSKNSSTQAAIAKEGQKMLAAIDPKDFVIALEVQGNDWTTEKLATHIGRWRDEGHNITILIGGPDGLALPCVQRANISWSLSKLTLPHPLVRVLLAEQIYRAFSILQNHPYHK
jgi:23S rRNA (pseudouridine1915-N3)-methyltransferase